MRDNLLEYTVFLRLSHGLEQLVESVGWEDLPVPLTEE